MASPDKLAAFAEQMRLSAAALAELAGAGEALGGDLVDAIRAQRDDVDRRLAGGAVTVALLGEPAARRSLMNAVVGERAFDPTSLLGPETVVSLRAAPAPDYTARVRNAPAITFVGGLPGRDSQSVRAPAPLRPAPAPVAIAPSPLLPVSAPSVVAHAAEAVAAGWFGRVWHWLMHWVLGVLSRVSSRPALSPLTAPSKPPPAEAQTAASATAEPTQSVPAKGPRPLRGQAQAFFEELRALTDRNARGMPVLSLSIVCPTPHLPGDVILVDGGDAADADGVVFVARERDAPPPEQLADLTRALHPATVQIVSGLAGLAPVLERLRAERPVVACARAAAGLRDCMARLSEEAKQAAAVCERRMAALEAARIPDPSEYRVRQLARVGHAVEQGAQDVEAAALVEWRASIARTRQGWNAGLEACTDRKEMVAFIETLNRTSSAQLQALVDAMIEHAISELQRVSETVQVWLLEEIGAQYHVARRAEEGDAPAAVIGEAIDLAPLVRPPLDRALDAFETRRVHLGLGGAAAGAALGTLFAPGIGTAIGAFLGVFAGLLNRVDSLKEACVARLGACLDEIEQAGATQIAARKASFAEALQASLSDALDQAFERRRASIARLMEVERKALDSERAKSKQLTKLRAALAEHTERLATFEG